jgi:phage FluMu protein Com
MTTKRSRYGYNIPDGYIQCKSCDAMVKSVVSNIYVYGFCPECYEIVPDYIPAEQWGDYINAYRKKSVSGVGLPRV